MIALVIEPAELSQPQIAALIAFHQQTLWSISPPGTSFALDVSGLADPAMTVLAAWDGDTLAGVGALKRLEPGRAEIKSMRTDTSYLRRGIATQLLDALIGLAREWEVERLSLETGSGPNFEPALALYRQRGFVNGPAFADYRNGDFNQCLHLDL